MIVLGVLLVLHGLVMGIATVGAIIGYILRKMPREAVEAALTFGISMLVEVIVGINLIF